MLFIHLLIHLFILPSRLSICIEPETIFPHIFLHSFLYVIHPYIHSFIHSLINLFILPSISICIEGQRQFPLLAIMTTNQKQTILHVVIRVSQSNNTVYRVFFNPCTINLYEPNGKANLDTL